MLLHGKPEHRDDQARTVCSANLSRCQGCYHSDDTHKLANITPHARHRQPRC